MAVYASKVVTIALSQVGYKEYNNNQTKYAKDLDAIDFYNTKKYPAHAEWCDIFVDWCVWQASGKNKDLALKTLYEPKKDNCGAGCKYSARYYKANEAWFKTPKVGDQIFFGKEGSESHTGIVVSVGVSTISTVEGNKGNAVKKCSYSKNDSKIAGYGRPKYDAEPQPQPQPTPTPTPTPTPKGKKYKCICKSGVNIRSGAGAKYKKVGAVNYGQVVTIYSTKDGWGNTTTSGDRWVCMKYFKAV